MKLDRCSSELVALLEEYIARLRLPTDRLWVTTDRATYGEWLNRRIPSAYGGAYCYLGRKRVHAVLIHLDRIDLTRPENLEIVVAEELIHMRDHLDGDRRRHAHHGHDRIAIRVSEMTGQSLEAIRSALKPVTRRPYRYVYQCPGCQRQVRRRRRGTWSCGECSPRFDRRFVLEVVETL